MLVTPPSNAAGVAAAVDNFLVAPEGLLLHPVVTVLVESLVGGSVPV